MRRCSAATQDGRPCRAFALVDSAFCFWHDPASASTRDAARRLGGDHRSPAADPAPFTGVNLKPSEGLRSMAELLIQQTCALPNSVQRSRALGYVVLAQRVEALEQVLKLKKVIDAPWHYPDELSQTIPHGAVRAPRALPPPRQSARDRPPPP